MKIHPSAIVSPKAEIHDSVEIGPNVVIEDRVKIGAGTRIWANAYIRDYTIIGENNEIHMGVVIGHDPQDVSFKRETESYVEIGNGNRIREYTTIHRGTKPGGKTVLGNDNYIFSQAHIAHDVKIGNNVIIANFAALGGHVKVGDRSFISGGVMLHQFVSVGRLVMISGNSAFSRNIGPFLTGIGQNLIATVNIVGMRRAGIPKPNMHEIRKAYDLFFATDKPKEERLAEVEAAGFTAPEVREVVDFIRGSTRALANTYRHKRPYNVDELLDTQMFDIQAE